MQVYPSKIKLELYIKGGAEVRASSLSDIYKPVTRSVLDTSRLLTTYVGSCASICMLLSLYSNAALLLYLVRRMSLF